ncbi:methyltransferase domain-containing protein [Micromonospora sp. DT44]|uniref:methyltransferase domain-containing protein n=1 Tax=Micromonospora sp. DT44 TaxID=3393439 RepID=UPI003CF8C06A
MGHNRLRHSLVDSDQSWSARQRRRRSEWLARTFPDIGDMHVVDLGGRLGTWHRATVRPARVTVVNLEQPPAAVPEWAHVEQADACDLPPRVANGAYDLVFSNSVLEHVGGHERRLRFAAAARSLADRHWVQTPYRYFPIEPHWIAPGMQFLPIRMRTALARRWPLGHKPTRSHEAAIHQVLWTELLDRSQMRHYFPDSTMLVERVFALPKSLIAVRTGR